MASVGPVPAKQQAYRTRHRISPFRTDPLRSASTCARPRHRILRRISRLGGTHAGIWNTWASRHSKEAFSRVWADSVDRENSRRSRLGAPAFAASGRKAASGDSVQDTPLTLRHRKEMLRRQILPRHATTASALMCPPSQRRYSAATRLARGDDSRPVKTAVLKQWCTVSTKGDVTWNAQAKSCR